MDKDVKISRKTWRLTFRGILDEYDPEKNNEDADHSALIRVELHTLGADAMKYMVSMTRTDGSYFAFEKAYT